MADLEIGKPDFVLKRDNMFAMYKEEVSKDGTKVWYMPKVGRIYFDRNNLVKDWVNYSGEWHERDVRHLGEKLGSNKKIFLKFKRNKDTDVFYYRENKQAIINSFESVGNNKIVNNIKKADILIEYELYRPEANVDISYVSTAVYNTEIIPEQTYNINYQSNSSYSGTSTNLYGNYNTTMHRGNVSTSGSMSITTPTEYKSVYAGQNTEQVKTTTYLHGMKFTGYKLTRGKTSKEPIFINESNIIQSSDKEIKDKIKYLTLYGIASMAGKYSTNTPFPLDQSRVSRYLKTVGFDIQFNEKFYTITDNDIEYGCTSGAGLSWCKTAIEKSFKENLRKTRQLTQVACQKYKDQPSCERVEELFKLKKEKELALKKEAKVCMDGNTSVCYAVAKTHLKLGNDSLASYYLRETIEQDHSYISKIAKEPKFEDIRNGILYKNKIVMIEKQLKKEQEKRRQPANK